MKGQLRRTVVGLFLFGISFGYVEAAVVIYLRALYEPLRQQLTPGRAAGDLFPLVDRDQMVAAAPETARLLNVEVIREAATILMLAAAAMLVTGERSLWLPAFSVAFGVWDISFYLFLKLWIGWPASLLTWDILFLLPVPWVAPVLAPVIVSITIVGCGVAALWRPVSIRSLHWIGLFLGGALVILSFTWDFRSRSGRESTASVCAGGYSWRGNWWAWDRSCMQCSGSGHCRSDWVLSPSPR